MALIDCIAELEKALGKALSDPEKAQLSKDVKAIIDNLSLEEGVEDFSAAIAKATKEHTDRVILMKAVEKRNALLQLKAFTNGVEFLNNWGSQKGEGLQAYLFNSLVSKKGSKSGAAGHIQTKRNKYVSGLQSELIQNGLDQLAQSDVLQKDIFFAGYELSKDVPDPAKLAKLDSQAVKIAEIMVKYQEASRLEANNAGAFIEKREGRFLRQSHDSDKIAGAAGFNVPLKNVEAHFKTWRADLEDAGLDWAAMGRDIAPENREKFLREAFTQFATGQHTTLSNKNMGVAVGSGNVGKKLSKARVIILKDVEGEWKYFQKYGKNSDGVSGSVVNGLASRARDIALMERLGPNPENTLSAIIQDQNQKFLREGADPETIKEFNKTATWAESAGIGELTGENLKAQNAVLAKIASVGRSTMMGADLSGAVMMSPTDVVHFAGTSTYFGDRSWMGYLKAAKDFVMTPIEGAFRTRETQAQIMSEFQIGLDMLIDTNKTYGENVDFSGKMSKYVSAMFRWTGLTKHQDNLRSAGVLSHAERLGQHAHLPMDQLPEGIAAALNQFDISAKEWDAIRSGEKTKLDGYELLSPTSIDTIQNEALDKTDYVAKRKSEILLKEKLLNEQVFEASKKDVDRLELRRKKYEDLKTDLKKSLFDFADKKMEVFGRRKEEISTKVELAQARIEKLEVEHDIAAYLRTEAERIRTGKTIDSVEAGDLFSDVARDKTNAALNRFSMRRGNIGESLGTRRARLETKIKDLEKRSATLTKDTGEALAAKEQKAIDKIRNLDESIKKAEAEVVSNYQERAKLSSEYSQKVDLLVQRAREKARTQLKDKFALQFGEVARYSAGEPGALENVMKTMGTKPGTLPGEIIRSGMMYKSFTLSMLRNTVGRTIHGFSPERLSTAQALKLMMTGKNNKGAAALANIVIYGTLGGYISMQANEIRKGKKPREITDLKSFRNVLMASMARSGALGIYSDFLFGEQNRFGGTFTSTAVGPVGRRLDDIIGIYQAAREGQDVGAKSFDFLRNNTPVVNMFANGLYTRAAFDYLIGYRMQELMNPGALRRMERRVKTKNDQEFIIPPSSVIPYGGK